MSFRFRVNHVWHNLARGDCHVIGVVEEGKIIPPVTAEIADRPGANVRIDSVALGGGVLSDGQITLVISHVRVDPKSLEGCELCDA